MAETFEGKIMALRKGFVSRESAEDHPVTMSLWKRVWVEPMNPSVKTGNGLPPFPWNVVGTGTINGDGFHYAYLTDATGRKFATILGSSHEKRRIADHILNLVNQPQEAVK